MWITSTWTIERVIIRNEGQFWTEISRILNPWTQELGGFSCQEPIEEGRFVTVESIARRIGKRSSKMEQIFPGFICRFVEIEEWNPGVETIHFWTDVGYCVEIISFVRKTDWRIV